MKPGNNRKWLLYNLATAFGSKFPAVSYLTHNSRPFSVQTYQMMSSISCSAGSPALAATPIGLHREEYKKKIL